MWFEFPAFPGAFARQAARTALHLDERIVLDKQENVISCNMAKPDPGWKEGF